MSTYLERHAYGTTTSEDLWRALAETSGLPIADVMNSWVKQKGFPLVSVCKEITVWNNSFSPSITSLFPIGSRCFLSLNVLFLIEA